MYILNEKDYIRSVLASKKKPEDLSIGYLIVLTAKYYYINNENIDFYSCHMGWWHDKEESFTFQVENLLAHAKESKNRAFFMGDFNNNAYVRNEGYDYLMKLGLKDTYVMAEEKDDGVTVKGKIAGWEMQEEDKRLDLILTNREIKVLRSKVIFNKDNKHIIVLAGRPYHVDPEVNHGIDKLITRLGAAVITEDSISYLTPKFKTTVLNQWTYHSRLYSAAKYCTEHEDIDLVQLVSFGCGLDAITTDETREILQSGNKLYTQLKIDEITNLGTVTIRLRSLFAALAERKMDKENQ